MATIFLDTSALIRRYDASEPGARRVRAICAPSPERTLLVARLTSVEVASALARRIRDGALLPVHQDQLWRLFRAHWRDQYHVVALTEEVYTSAEQLLFGHPLRACDALHIGCALVAAAKLPELPLQFWTADRRQAQAARAEGLAVELVA